MKPHLNISSEHNSNNWDAVEHHSFSKEDEKDGFSQDNPETIEKLIDFNYNNEVSFRITNLINTTINVFLN